MKITKQDLVDLDSFLKRFMAPKREVKKPLRAVQDRPGAAVFVYDADDKMVAMMGVRTAQAIAGFANKK